MGRCSSIISCSAGARRSSAQKILKERAIDRSRRRVRSLRNLRPWWHPRASVRQAVTLRVDYATPDGRVWLGLIRNLSLQGMFIGNVSCQETPALSPGISSPWPSCCPQGGPVSSWCWSCTVIAMGLACSFWRGIRNRPPILRAIGLRWRRQHGEAGYGPVWGGVVKPMRVLLGYVRNACDNSQQRRLHFLSS